MKQLKPTAQRLYDKLKELAIKKRVTKTKGELAGLINISAIDSAVKQLVESKLIRVDKGLSYNSPNTYVILK